MPEYHRPRSRVVRLPLSSQLTQELQTLIADARRAIAESHLRQEEFEQLQREQALNASINTDRSSREIPEENPSRPTNEELERIISETNEILRQNDAYAQRLEQERAEIRQRSEETQETLRNQQALIDAVDKLLEKHNRLFPPGSGDEEQRLIPREDARKKPSKWDKYLKLFLWGLFSTGVSTTLVLTVWFLFIREKSVSDSGGGGNKAIL